MCTQTYLDILMTDGLCCDVGVNARGGTSTSQKKGENSASFT